MTAGVNRVRLACWTALVATLAALNYYARFTGGSPSSGRDDVYRWSTFAGGMVVYGIWLGLVLAIAVDRTDLLALRLPGRWRTAAWLSAGVVVAIYVVSVRLGHNRLVVPVPPLGQWWTFPLLIITAIENALLEETVVLGYMVTRLQQIGAPSLVAIGSAALLRGTYHLYQGWGGFVGNLSMGLLFGAVFLRWRRTWPLVIAHALLDAGAGILYIAFRTKLPGILGG